jgi:hypothetical protein
MTQLGVRYTDAELGDIVHLWRCVGHFVGVDDDLLPATPDDYARIEALFALTAPGPDEGDRAFVAAMTSFQAAELARLLPASWAPAIIHGLQRAFIGDKAADGLAIRDTWCKHLPRVPGPLTAAAYQAHDTLFPDGKNRRTIRGYRTQAKTLERLRNDHAVRHELVDDTPETCGTTQTCGQRAQALSAPDGASLRF